MKRMRSKFLLGIAGAVAIIAAIPEAGNFVQSIGVPKSILREIGRQSEKYSRQTTIVTSAGEISVYDGDTIKIGGQRMRLLDIDTPEISKPRCSYEEKAGSEARDRLRELIGQAGTVEIIDSGTTDKYGRNLIHVEIDGRDAGKVLLNEGLALRYRGGSAAWSARKRHWCG
ncbi:thermonuclease family protein [Martelella radicis]|uniref:Endonuclease YncB(Thermonuclease family) n=1 Tax=Martelella radicis TaxID=1397476 RepID=A0A7W6PB73_9HYPH|nr:thermonuclease family protein [Martelella radicis]MBB4123595.1 endonuclease YncB(thermonuclease family) [Martelella radicis]